MVLFYLLIIIYIINGIEFSGKIDVPSTFFSVSHTKGPECKDLNIILSGPRGRSYSTKAFQDCSFKINSVSPGSYIIDISGNYQFPTLRLDVTKSGKMRLSSMYTDIMKNIKISNNVIRAVKHHEYFEERKSFNMLGYLKNPMVIFLGIGLIFVLFSNKFVDTEEYKEAQKTIKEGGGFIGGMLDKLNKMGDDTQKKLK